MLALTFRGVTGRGYQLVVVVVVVGLFVVVVVVEEQVVEMVVAWVGITLEW